jgi:hypothetical protein
MSLHLFPAKPIKIIGCSWALGTCKPRIQPTDQPERKRGRCPQLPMRHVQSTESSENYPGPAQQRGRLCREEETRGQTSRASALAGCRAASSSSSSSLCSRLRYWTRRSRRDGESCAEAARRGSWTRVVGRFEVAGWPRRWAAALLKG